jgi:curved DNA-binding protein CbpA
VTAAHAEAYDTLSDANARGKYNAQLEQALKDDEDDYTGQVNGQHVMALLLA